jgi:hypothetical protein
VLTTIHLFKNFSGLGTTAEREREREREREKDNE